MDRMNLAAWSLDLNDEDYVKSLAAFGVLTASLSSREARVLAMLDELPEIKKLFQAEFLAQLFNEMHQANGLLAWRFPSPMTRKRNLRIEWPSARTLAESWQQFLNIKTGDLRLALSRKGTKLHFLLPCINALQRQAVWATSVFVADAFTTDGRTDWSWPYKIATLPGDPLAGSFEEEQTQLPPSWPYGFTVADREHARNEILVCSGSLRDTLATVVAGPLRRRMAMVILLGGIGDAGIMIDPLLQTLAAELSAEGVAYMKQCTGLTNVTATEAIHRLADELSHNVHLDVALQQIFGTSVTALLNQDLLKMSHLSHTATDLSLRLKNLPKMVDLHLSENSLYRLRVPTTVLMTGATHAVKARFLAGSLDANKDSFQFISEGNEAMALSEVSRKLSESEAEHNQLTENSRFIQYRLFRKSDGGFVEENQRLEVGTTVLLKVRIGPSDTEWQTAPVVFPDHLLPKRRKSNRLQVMFHEPDQLDQPLLREILLPQKGASNGALFTFTPRQAAPFRGRITILHRGRVLQTALVQAIVCEAGAPEDQTLRITRQPEARVRNSLSDLGSRRAFDMAIVLNHTTGERPMLTAVSAKHAWARDLTAIDDTVAQINDELSNVATSVADYSKGLLTTQSEALFVRLARIGANLYSHLFIDNLQTTQTDNLNLETEEYIQVISTRADAVVPLEFLYQYTPPEIGARICPHAVEALRNIACPTPCKYAERLRDYVCPLGFWGLSKVIERHVFNARLVTPGQEALTVQAEPLDNRDRLELDHGVVLGYSKQVANVKVTESVKRLDQIIPNQINLAGNWDEWHEAVKRDKPTLLVAFPHNQGTQQDIKLEIHNDLLETLRLPFERDYVHVQGAPYPLVMLLGCDTAGTAQQYASHVGYFRQAGAAAVISTIATVFGEHAVIVGEKLLSRLFDAARPKNNRLGELLRDVKREAVAESLPMALCIVAFGDADWRL